MKRKAILSTVLCLALLAAGCNGTKETTSTESKAPETSAEATEAETSDEPVSETETSGTPRVGHEISVEDSITTLSDEYGEYKSILPKVTIDGKEATEINEEISNFVQENYALETDGNYVEGFETRYIWGSEYGIISFVIAADYISEDYSTCEVFNYDLETLAPMDDLDMRIRLNMTEDELYSQIADVYTKCYSDRASVDLDKAIENISFDNITLFVTPDRNPGVVGIVALVEGSQFSEITGCFDLTSMDYVSFS